MSGARDQLDLPIEATMMASQAFFKLKRSQQVTLIFKLTNALLMTGGPDGFGVLRRDVDEEQNAVVQLALNSLMAANIATAKGIQPEDLMDRLREMRDGG